jgi:NIMA-interacting peptidyl-prolyl cis-trans isomerase 1
LIKGYQNQIKAFEQGMTEGNPKSLSELATTESDCSSARKGGDLYVIIIISNGTRHCSGPCD